MRLTLVKSTKPLDVCFVGYLPRYAEMVLKSSTIQYTVVPTAFVGNLPPAKQYVALSLCASAALRAQETTHVVVRNLSSHSILQALD